MANISGSVYGRQGAPLPPSPLSISLTSPFACLVRVVDIEVQVVGMVMVLPQLIRGIAVADGGVPAAITCRRSNAMEYCSL
jgi:hypothetical protein